MARAIKLTEALKVKLVREFVKTLTDTRLTEGKIEFSAKLDAVERKATLLFENDAWEKMRALVDSFDKEIAWHGVARRGENKDEYIISDILIFPQKVTGVTVTTDQEEYEKWCMSLEDDIFNNMRMQGHSHVNMGVTPSSVDNTLYEQILDKLQDDMFYIFIIANKKGDMTVKIYDLAENMFFDTKDVEVINTTALSEFVAQAKKLVKDNVVTQIGLVSTTSSNEDSSSKRKGKRKTTTTENLYSDSYYGLWY